MEVNSSSLLSRVLSAEEAYYLRDLFSQPGWTLLHSGLLVERQLSLRQQLESVNDRDEMLRIQGQLRMLVELLGLSQSLFRHPNPPDVRRLT